MSSLHIYVISAIHLPICFMKLDVRRSHSFSSSSDESESGSSASLESAFASRLEFECCDSLSDISPSPSLSFSLFIEGIGFAFYSAFNLHQPNCIKLHSNRWILFSFQNTTKNFLATQSFLTKFLY